VDADLLVSPMAEAQTKPAAPQLDPAVAADLASLALQLSHNPDTRREFGKLVRKAAPESRHAAAFKDVELEDRFQTFEEKQAEKELKRQQDEIVARMNVQRQSLLNGGADGNGRKYSEDDVAAIEALMQKKGISDYDDGATLYAATLPPVTKPENEPPVHGTTWEFPEFGKFGKDPVRASREIAGQVIAEFQRKQR
jgi:hypothetical protein